MRNGIVPYQLLERPAEFFRRYGEVVTRDTLDLRRTRAEQERQYLLSSLRRQYSDVCAPLLRRRSDPRCCCRARGRLCQCLLLLRKGRARRSKSCARLKRTHAPFARAEIEQKRAIAERMFLLERQLCERRQQRDAAIRERSETLRARLERKRRVVDQIHSIEEELHVEGRPGDGGQARGTD